MSAWRSALIVAASAALLTGCVQAQTLNPRFGASVHEAVLAQVSDPEAVYKGDPAPGSDGARVGLAQERYRTGKVIKPVNLTASTVAQSQPAAAN